MTAYLGLGTNLGADKAGNLHQAINLIGEQAGHVLACSSFIETEPWGFDSPHRFLNAVVAIETPYTARELLKVTQSIEKALGRTCKTTGTSYADRVIDIDILLYGDEVIAEPDLTIPHAHLLEREFAYLPLLEIAPDIAYPANGLPLSTLVS